MTAVDELAALHFAAGLPAFPFARRFRLEPWGVPGGPFRLMRSLDDPHLAFVVTHPKPFFPDFAVDLDNDVVDRLCLRSADDAFVLVIVTMREHAATANLLGPIVVNTATSEARQVVLHDSHHDVRTPLPAQS